MADEHESKEAANTDQGGLLANIRRRGVLRVALAYLAVAWLILQVIDTLISLGVFEEWLGQYAFYALLAGLPVALILSWYFEITPEGIRPDTERDSTRSATSFGRRLVDQVIIAALSMVIVLLVIDNYVLDADSPGALDNGHVSIAVIPFENRSTDPEQQSFADGLTDELLNSLSGVRNLRVISRSSSFRFRDPDVPIAIIAADLSVDHVLQGAVRRGGDTIRVTAQLTDANADAQIWSGSYDRELTVSNVLDIQQDIAIAVANSLHAEFRRDVIEVPRVSGPASIEALNLYHDGWFYLRQIETGQGDEETTDRSIESFEASIAADPDWAPTHAALGRVYHFRMDHGYREEDRRLSRLHVMRAIELDDQYAPAYVSLAYLNHMAGDFQGAQEAYNRVRTLGHDAPWAIAIFASSIGKFDEAIREYRRAITLDPLAIPIKFQLAQNYGCAGRYQESLAEFAKLQTDFPDIGQGYIPAYLHAKTGQFQRALALVREFEQDVGTTLGPQNIVYALAGMPERARAALTDDAIQGFDRAGLAATAVAIGDLERALNLLEQASKEKVLFPLLFMQCWEELRSLAGNPRYEKVLDTVGFPD